MIEIEYLTDGGGQPKAVVLPIELWRRILPSDDATEEELSDEVEAYCLGKAMDQGRETPLLDRDQALENLKS
jgi:hypothetical protein